MFICCIRQCIHRHNRHTPSGLQSPHLHAFAQCNYSLAGPGHMLRPKAAAYARRNSMARIFANWRQSKCSRQGGGEEGVDCLVRAGRWHWVRRNVSRQVPHNIYHIWVRPARGLAPVQSPTLSSRYLQLFDKGFLAAIAAINYKLTLLPYNLLPSSNSRSFVVVAAGVIVFAV